MQQIFTAILLIMVGVSQITVVVMN